MLPYLCSNIIPRQLLVLNVLPGFSETDHTECCARVGNACASHSGGLIFKSWPRYFSVFFVHASAGMKIKVLRQCMK